MLRILLTSFVTCCLASTLYAQADFSLVNGEAQEAILSDVDQQFIQARMDELDLAACAADVLQEPPRIDYRVLRLKHAGNMLNLVVQPDVMRSGNVLLYSEEPDGLVEYTNCDTTRILPVLAIMATTVVEEESEPRRTRLNVLASNSYLTSHEPNRLMGRTDSDDDSRFYLDFTLSSKHPVLPNATLINNVYESFTDVAESLIPGQDDYFMQMYLAFNGRFSQYIGSRNSAPVVARRFNPSLFWRFWTSPDSYLDLGVGHESNGQTINSEEGFEREQQRYLDEGEPAVYARDSLSRGWDYSFLSWQTTISSRLSTHLQLRHFMTHGPLQDGAEEYNTWEDVGSVLRPRRRYDGIRLDLSYDFGSSKCSLGSSYICFQKISLKQETGYSAAFENNTTTIELTTNFFGMPIQLWGRSGYNSDLVDYYNYSNSWGIGFELISR